MNGRGRPAVHGLIGSLCSVRCPDGVRRGVLLEVRRLWSSRGGAMPLVGFVRIKDADHRLSGWFMLEDIELKEVRGVGEDSSMPMSAAARITQPLLSPVYTEVTAGMTRALREEKQLDFFEERLLRDCRTPTTIRYFVYLGTYVFAPWYYSPYGIFHPDFDVSAHVVGESKNSIDITHRATESREEKGVGKGIVNPYIRDAYLCPFSLRVYSTLEQMLHETQCYRKGLLRPPGIEIYRDDTRGFSLFEVNGSRQVTYCRQLFLLGKSFLENKLAGHDVHNYYFFVVCLHQRHFPHYTNNTSAMYFVGYFTWEKQVAVNNLACILTLPCFAGGAQGSVRLGHFGQFMISASYELAYRRNHIGSPEKPLSDLGAFAYNRYWCRVLVEWMYGLVKDKAADAVHIIDVDNDDERDGDSEISEEATRRKRKRSDNEAAHHPRQSQQQQQQQQQREVIGSFSVRGIAQVVRLEEADVLRALLHMGVLHRNTEDRSIRLVIPVDLVHREHAKTMARARDSSFAVFDAALLQRCSSSASITGKQQK